MNSIAWINWTKQNGNPLRTNDLPATIVYCEKLGMKRAGSSPNEVPGPNEQAGPNDPIIKDTPVVADPTPYPE